MSRCALPRKLAIGAQRRASPGRWYQIRVLLCRPAGEAVGVVMDASGHLAVVSCSDGGVAVYDLEAGRLVARGSGHGDVCTGALLLEDHRGLVTVGGDGCALMWRLTTPLARRMQEAAAQCQRQLERQAAAQAAAVQATPAGARRRGEHPWLMLPLGFVST